MKSLGSHDDLNKSKCGDEIRISHLFPEKTDIFIGLLRTIQEHERPWCSLSESSSYITSSLDFGLPER